MNKPRPYQVEAKNAVINAKDHSVAISLPTGTGKTFIAKMIIDEIIRNPMNRVLFVVNADILMQQSGEAFDTENYHGGGKVANWDRPLVIGMIQTLHRICPADFGVTHIIIDEAHHAVSSTYQAILQDRTHYDMIISLSATMFRADGKGLSDVVDKVVYEKDIHWAISQGYLTTYQIMRPKNAGELPFSYRTYKMISKHGEESLREVISYDHPQRNEMVRDMALSLMEEHSRKAGVIFCNTIEHCKKLAELMGEGWGWCGGSHRKDIKRFKRGELKGIVSCQLLLEGFDHPPADFLIVNGTIKADSTGLIRWIQLLGRVLRLYKDKTYALVIDLCKERLHDPQYSSNLAHDPGAVVEEDECECEEKSSILVEEVLDECVLKGVDFIGALVKINEEYLYFKRYFSTILNIREIKPNEYDVLNSEFRFRTEGTKFIANDGLRETVYDNFATMEGAVLKSGSQWAAFDNRRMKGNVTAGQKKILLKNNYSEVDIECMSKSDASGLISRIFSIKDDEPASPKQKWLLKKHGITYEGELKKRTASKLIAEIKKAGKI